MILRTYFSPHIYSSQPTYKDLVPKFSKFSFGRKILKAWMLPQETFYFIYFYVCVFGGKCSTVFALLTRYTLYYIIMFRGHLHALDAVIRLKLGKIAFRICPADFQRENYLTK